MPELSVIAQPKSTAIELLVADYLAACRARGVSAKSIRFSYGYSLDSVFLPWCAGQEITEPAELSSRLLDRFSAELLERPGKRGQLLAKDRDATAAGESLRREGDGADDERTRP
jgi:hypothetical protein